MRQHYNEVNAEFEMVDENDVHSMEVLKSKQEQLTFF
jgi:hypothetical protein